jgi:hypothetical protein
MCEHRGSGREGHFVLTRAAAVKHAEAQSFHPRRIQEPGGGGKTTDVMLDTS